MRLAQAIFLGAAAALLTLAVPTLAKNPDSQKNSEQPASASCHAYQQADDGSWTQLPCQERGSRTTAQPRSTSKSTDDETH